MLLCHRSEYARNPKAYRQHFLRLVLKIPIFRQNRYSDRIRLGWSRKGRRRRKEAFSY
jgi:hypothetical protein